MEKYTNIKKGTLVGLIISMVLLLAVLVNNIFAIGRAVNLGITIPAMFAIIDVVMCVVILLYAFFGYKKPHGNMLKFTFLAYAGYLALQGTIEIGGRSAYVIGVVLVFAGLTIAYVAGRLNKIEKNKLILFVVEMVLLARIVVVFLRFPVSLGFSTVFDRITPNITFTALSFAYIARYEQHKAAGLEEK